MLNQECGAAPAGREWMGWPMYDRTSDVLQIAIAVIATTRRAWVGRGAADETPPDCARFAHPLLRIVPDATSGSAVRSQIVGRRSRLGASDQFAS